MTLSIVVVFFPTPIFFKAFISGLLGYSLINSRPNDVSNYRVDAHEGIGSQFYWGYLFPVNDTFSIGPEIGFGYNCNKSLSF